jgi:hypothetical protein
MPDILDYETLVQGYNEGLLTTLRGHGAGAGFLEAWVPDEDTINSIVNMVEAAESSGHYALTVRVTNRALPVARHGDLARALAPMGHVEIERVDGGALVKFSGRGR